ncbi:MAG: molecular chaperone DnaJ [Candidatus Nanohalarchaeota archaeon]|nr:MAG: molecular chaperone DnaJ [Candidatus Nanohaloarchaeota archaeon]
MGKDYYSILGVDKDASKSEIKKAYRNLVKKYHPDLTKGNKENEEKLKEINEAYSVLGDKNKKEQYDRFGSEGFKFDGTGGQGGFGGFEGVHVDYEDVGDVFENIFSGFGGGFSPFGKRQRNGPVRGEDLIYQIDLEFREAVFGCKKNIYINVKEKCASCNGTGAKDGIMQTCSMCKGSGKIREEKRTIFGSFASVRMCPKCNGTGKERKEKCNVCGGKGFVSKEKEITITVPEGVDNGYKIRLGGSGNAGKRGGPPGDLYILISVKEDAVFERKESDIYNTVHIPFTAAVLGGSAKIATLTGTTDLKIPSGTQSGTIFRLGGKGIRDPLTGRKGNQMVKIIVDIPTKLSEEQKKHIMALSELELGYDHVEHNETFFDKIKDKFF